MRLRPSHPSWWTPTGAERSKERRLETPAICGTSSASPRRQTRTPCSTPRQLGSSTSRGHVCCLFKNDPSSSSSLCISVIGRGGFGTIERVRPIEDNTNADVIYTRVKNENTVSSAQNPRACTASRVKSEYSNVHEGELWGKRKTKT